MFRSSGLSLRHSLKSPVLRRTSQLNASATFALKRNALLINNINSRQYSSGGGAGNGGSGSSSYRLMMIGGLVLAGVGLYAVTSNGSPPTSYVEPKKEATIAGPAFKEGEVSVIFVLGGPGAGKGTQCNNMVKDYGFVHLSAGDLLRAEQTRADSKYGEMIAQYIKDGLIVPQEVTVALLEQAMKAEVSKGNTKFLIDGFPRKMDQAITFEDQIAKSSFTLFFDCPESVMLTRLLERGKTSGRADDNVESIKKRFRTFIDTSMPVVEYFGKQGKVVKVYCDSPVDQVYSEVKSALKDKLNL